MSTPPIETYERLDAFYLGRRYDLATRSLTEEPVLYDAQDLVTHAVIVGMTGSGKTGLGISLIEEAAIDGVPVLAIDPKGDLSNLLLTFPDLSPSDFAPWVDADEAARRGMTTDAFAAAEADTWKKGLAAWGQDGQRIARLRAAADFAVYTPGSRAGRPLSILQSFGAPSPEEREDPERMAEAVTTTATSLLALLGIDADPAQSREHMLLAAILNDAWSKAESVDLPLLIARIQRPAFSRVGVMELEAFFPEKERFALVMRINGLVASPSFALWTEGEPLDVAKLLHTAEGKPRVAIVSIAHLADAERMFFVTSLLNRVVAWMRSQSGTSSLRAMLYLDEVMGYMPPVANPPSKQALLLLMKQARAFGLGVVLATQNPVDLDYKGLSNAGTWCIGRLQTERDKARLLDGLESASSGSGAGFDRAQTERTLSSLEKRTFLLHNVHEKEPVVFQTRWAMSYLRGPLTKDQIKRLPTSARRSSDTIASSPAVEPSGGPNRERSRTRPVLPPGITQRFVRAAAQASPLSYRPYLLAEAQVRFADAKRNVDLVREVRRFVPFASDGAPNWAASELALGVDPRALDADPVPNATFEPLPGSAAKASSYAAWLKELGRSLQQSEVLALREDPQTKLTQAPDESGAGFLSRVALADREARDAKKEALRKKYAPKMTALVERIRRAEQAVQQQSQQASDAKVQTGISVFGSIAGALLGSRKIGVGTIGKATTAARGVGRSMREASDVQRAQETLAAHRAELASLEAEIEAATSEIEGRQPVESRVSVVEIRPKKTHVEPIAVTLVWRPISPAS